MHVVHRPINSIFTNGRIPAEFHLTTFTFLRFLYMLATTALITKKREKILLCEDE